MKIISHIPELTFKDVLLLPAFSDFKITEENKVIDLKTKISKKLEIDIPICSSPMPYITGINMAKTIGMLGGIGFIHCFQSFEEQLRQVKEIKSNKIKVAVSVFDYSERGFKHISNLVSLNTDLICIETHHGFNYHTIDFLKKIKSNFPNTEVCVSLVVTAEATKSLIEAGADSIRVGIGGGSHCTTRLVTGVGRPQLSAVYDCYKIAKKYNVPIISDTGIEYPGDIAKALAFGASAVMVGGLLAGTSECPGKIIRIKGKRYKYSAGMCSSELEFNPLSLRNKKFYSIRNTVYNFFKRKNFNESSIKNQHGSNAHEGVSGLIPYKGDVVLVVDELIAGLKRSMWYLGCKNIKEINKKTKVVIVTENTQSDNLPRI